MGAMDELLNPAAISGLAGSLSTAAPDITFTELRRASDHLDGLKLRSRTDLVTAALLADLPADYRSVAAIFRSALQDSAFAGWPIWPVTETVTTLAVESPDPGAFEDGLSLLAELTPRLSSEFAIRRFLTADLTRALTVIETWTADPDETVRRLASEGTRSFLPWAIRVKQLLDAPASTVPIIDALYRDSSEVVRRSVANHLNDLSRRQPELTTRIAANWLANSDENTKWVVRHATRTLIKKGYPPALALLGFAPARITVAGFALDTTTVTTPGDLGFEFTVTNSDTAPITLAIDYAVDYRKNNGSSASKVFKLTTRTLAPAETVLISKRHNFRPMTTRVHYSGEHSIWLQINGERYPGKSFDLQV